MKIFIQPIDNGAVGFDEYRVLKVDGTLIGRITEDTMNEDGLRIQLDVEHSSNSGTSFISLLDNRDEAIRELVRWAVRSVDVEIVELPVAMTDPDAPEESPERSL